MLKDFINSFKVNTAGLSGRKLTAFNIVIQIDLLHLSYYYSLYKKQSWAAVIFTEVLIIDFCAVAILLGLVTFQQITEFKNGISKSTTTTETTETKVESGV